MEPKTLSKFKEKLTMKKTDEESIKNRTGKALEKARKIAQGEITPPKLRKPKKLFKKVERNKSFSKKSAEAFKKSVSHQNVKDTYTSITNSEVSFAPKQLDRRLPAVASAAAKQFSTVETFRHVHI